MHRHERPSVGTIEQTASLPQLARKIHQLHIRRWQSRDHVVTKTRIRSQLSSAHTRGHGLRTHRFRRRRQGCPAEIADHSRQDSVQSRDTQSGICPLRHQFADVQS